MEQPLAKPRLSLSVKLSVGLTLFIVLLFASINIYTVREHREIRIADAERQMQNVSLVLLGNLAADISESDETMKQAVIRDTLGTAREMMKRSDLLAFVMLTTAKFKLVQGVARPAIVAFPDGVTPADETATLEKIARLKGNLGGPMRITRLNITLNNGETQAIAWAGISLAKTEAETRAELITNVVALAVALLLILIYASVVLGRMVVSPLRRIMHSMRAVHGGDLSQEVAIEKSDEIGVLASNFNFMLQGLREREQLKDAFNRYVSRQVYEKLKGGELRLSGEEKNATILFSDIRSFTSLSERLSAPEIVEMLNEYFTEMVEIVFRYDGFINKFIGDAIMAVYNAPLEQAHPELRAVRTAVEMQHALARLNQKRQARGQIPIKVGIGINTGPVVAGNIGHEKRLEYTVIGDAVNLAQRIESQTKVTGTTVLISEATYRAVASHVTVEPLQPVKVKGKQEPVRLYSVTGLRRTSNAPPPSVAVP
ncbi:MAG: adenylate/guanylate cyclase domain-containing protein [Myxococcota bacterium]